jgi:hypothetical protein
MIADIVQLDPFNYVAGRQHDSFPEIKKSLLKYLNLQRTYLNIVQFHKWLDKHKAEFPN